MCDATDQDPRQDELKRLVDAFKQASASVAPRMRVLGTIVSSAVIQLKQTMAEFDKAFREAMKDNPPDDKVGAKK